MSSDSENAIRKHEIDDAELQRPEKKAKLDDETAGTETAPTEPEFGHILETTEPAQLESHENTSVLPPSHRLLGIKRPLSNDDSVPQIMESDVGISEYVGRDIAPINAIIKQRFTDFLVFEIDLDGQVVHLKNIGKPSSSKKKESEEPHDGPIKDVDPTDGSQEGHSTAAADATSHTVQKEVSTDAPEDGSLVQAPPKEEEPWPERYTQALHPFLSEALILQVKQMYLEGREPPRLSDNGWARRPVRPTEEGASEVNEGSSQSPEKSAPHEKGKRGRGSGSRGRGARGGGRGGRSGKGDHEIQDHRKVISDPISSKETRTAFHKVVREMFGGKLDTETDTSTPAAAEGSRIVIKWARKGGRRQPDAQAGGKPGDRHSRETYPPYIHFTMQKTNRDTQDALVHLSRILHVNVKDLSVAGTKDKRGVTVQRVSLKRGKKTVEEIWSLANGRKPMTETLSQRGDRGVRLGDFNYRKAHLELGMLKGNAFIITLRNVQVESVETIDRAMETIQNKGFINYYGMQRFGTAAVPTHAIGLALLQSDWHKAVSLILQKRSGEHPDVVAARDAWLVDNDLDKALELMPRRVVAERCILESYKKQKGDTRNAMGSLSTIPRNLRLMYVHAYQSYLWNAVVSERIRKYGCDKPVVGDLVFDNEAETRENAQENEELQEVHQEPAVDNEVDNLAVEEDHVKEEPDLSSAKARKDRRKPWAPPKVRTLTADELDNYTIFDVIMPLPGTDVAYPGGELGEMYKSFIQADGLDPDNFKRKQREYTLGGSYRKILHLPKVLSWSVLRYTNPDVALAQADEDKLLDFDPPAIVEDGKFLALQINLSLGTAAYATMLLREVTKTETSSHFQTSLTQTSEDQKYKMEVV